MNASESSISATSDFIRYTKAQDVVAILCFGISYRLGLFSLQSLTIPLALLT
ncbi:MAG: hypothetical protein ACKO7R_20340 [Pseudanabaena sp.]